MIAEGFFAGRQSALKKTNQTDQRQNFVFCDDIPFRGKKLKNKINSDVTMESHPKSATVENNEQNTSDYIIQKRQIAQRHARQSKTLKAFMLLP